MANVYVPGMDVLLSGAFFNVSGAPVDPTTVTLKVRKEGVGITTYVYLTDAFVTRTSVGVFYRKYTPASAGVYFYRWEGTGALASAYEGMFIVNETNF